MHHTVSSTITSERVPTESHIDEAQAFLDNIVSRYPLDKINEIINHIHSSEKNRRKDMIEEHDFMVKFIKDSLEKL